MQNTSPESRPQFLAGNLALYFLNTRMRVDGESGTFFRPTKMCSRGLSKPDSRIKDRRHHKVSVAFTCCADAAREHPLTCGETKGWSLWRSFGAQQLSKSREEPSSPRVEEAALGQHRQDRAPGQARGYFGTNSRSGPPFCLQTLTLDSSSAVRTMPAYSGCLTYRANHDARAANAFGMWRVHRLDRINRK